MSSLSVGEILGHPERNGVYRLAGSLTVPDALHIAGGDLAGKPAMMTALSAVFALPDWFGHNWDALQDCLSDLSWLAGDVVLVIDRAELPARLAPDSWVVLLDILADVARYWRGEGRSFAVFLHGGHDAYPLVAA